MTKLFWHHRQTNHLHLRYRWGHHHSCQVSYIGFITAQGSMKAISHLIKRTRKIDNTKTSKRHLMSHYSKPKCHYSRSRSCAVKSCVLPKNNWEIGDISLQHMKRPGCRYLNCHHYMRLCHRCRVDSFKTHSKTRSGTWPCKELISRSMPWATRGWVHR